MSWDLEKDERLEELGRQPDLTEVESDEILGLYDECLSYMDDHPETEKMNWDDFRQHLSTGGTT